MPDLPEYPPHPVIGPLGEVLTREALPVSRAIRWNARRKAEVVIAVAQRMIGLAEALDLYGLTAAELSGWHNAYYRGGLNALKRKNQQMGTGH